MSRATEAQLADLHGLTWEVLMEELVRCRAKAASDPDYQFPHQLFAQATKFLKDNGIQAAAPEKLHDQYLDAVTRPLDGLDDDFPLNGFN
jgi:hypothetical protein